MLPVNVTQLFPDNTPPEPPPFAVRWQAQRAIELADYEWRLNMRQMYPQRLPAEIPYWYPRKKTMLYAYGKHPQPVDTLADVRKQLDNRYRRLGLVAAADRADVTERIEWSNAA
jgi:hypothetical protein